MRTGMHANYHMRAQHVYFKESPRAKAQDLMPSFPTLHTKCVLVAHMKCRASYRHNCLVPISTVYANVNRDYQLIWQSWVLPIESMYCAHASGEHAGGNSPSPRMLRMPQKVSSWVDSHPPLSGRHNKWFISDWCLWCDYVSMIWLSATAKRIAVFRHDVPAGPAREVPVGSIILFWRS